MADQGEVRKSGVADFTASAKGQNGVTGLANTLEALNENRVCELV